MPPGTSLAVPFPLFHHDCPDIGTDGQRDLYPGAPRAGRTAERRDSLYYENGILCDSISSLVTQAGLVLLDHASRFRSPLICTSRQPSVAALRLLDLLAREGTIVILDAKSPLYSNPTVNQSHEE